MRFVFPFVLSFVLLVGQSAAAAPQETFIQNLGKEVVDILKKPDDGSGARQAAFRRIMTSNFDLASIGKFAMGRHWRDATPAQQSQYQKLFREMVVIVYTQRFSDYSGQELLVKGSVPAGGSKGDVFVKSEIRQPDGPPLMVDWRVRGAGGNYKIIDAVVEGVSMSVTQRSEFDAVIAQSGIDGLLADIKARLQSSKAKK